MVFLVVYIGAIAVLFLFVVMMINIRYVELTAKELFYLPLNGIFLIVPLSLEIAFYFYVSAPFNAENFESVDCLPRDFFRLRILEVLGYLLYNPRYTWIVFLSALYPFGRYGRSYSSYTNKAF